MCMMIYVLFWIFGFVYSDKCYNSSSNGVTGSWFCCNNHEDRNGICTECVVGYVSKDGLPCMPCLYGRYGKKCGNICSCQHDERCDIVYGCIEGTTVIQTGFVQDGKCYNKSSNGVNKSWFCCNNHEEENGKCKAFYHLLDWFKNKLSAPDILIA
ncbi:uncharacterized protein [Mytilus edulis]|uniref:uncharacterized protein n=1 Tax=Mytilus edulis TaxID=6550 RepID=UPI0039EEAC52